MIYVNKKYSAKPGVADTYNVTITAPKGAEVTVMTFTNKNRSEAWFATGIYDGTKLTNCTYYEENRKTVSVVTFLNSDEGAPVLMCVQNGTHCFNPVVMT